MKKFYSLITVLVFALQLLVPTQLEAQCTTPMGLSVTNITANGAYLYLSPTSTNVGTFNIRYHTANSTVLTTVEHVTLPYQLGNLACGTTYEWQAQLICPTTAGTIPTLSPWSAGGTFTTLACNTISCAVPTGLTTTDINQTSALLHWNAVSGAVAYVVRYKKGTSTTTEFTIVTSSSNTITLTGLTAGAYYIWQVQAVCSTTTVGGMSVFSTLATFATPSVMTFPNPANEFVNVTFWLAKSSNTTIVLLDSYGHVVYSSVVLTQDGTNQFEINTSGLSTGLYFLTVRTNFYTITSKLVISH